MNAPAQYNRRQILKGAIATTAAGSLARLAAAEEPAISTPFAESLIDTQIYIDHWPHARVPGDEPRELVTTLRRNNVSHAWTGSFDGLFHKDVGTVNQRLADYCAQQENGLLIPFGTVNPTLPDWEEDIRRCHEQFEMPGIRLHPNYHGYTLDDPRFTRLLNIAAERKLIVQLVAWLDDARHTWLTPAVVQVDLKPLAQIISKQNYPSLIIAGASGEAADKLVSSKQVYFDFSHLPDKELLTSFANRASTDCIVFGSGSPLHSIESARSKLQDAKLSMEQRNAIASRVAEELMVARRKLG